MPIPFTREYQFTYAKLETLSPIIRRITARNPSPYTFHGTATYIIGHEHGVAIIDPGPLLEEHVDALKEELKKEEVTHIFITHTHSDHSPAAKALKEYWKGVKTYGYGPHGSGRTSTSSSSSSHANSDDDEEADMNFVPGVLLRDGDVIHGHNWTIEAVYTPGHTSNHVCYALQEENVLFTGDHVMGWSTSVIVPPDGNMTDYIDSLHKLSGRKEDVVYWPTHGTCIKNVKEFVEAYIEHRYERKDQVRKCLLQDTSKGEGKGMMKIGDMVPLIYQDLDEKLYGAAARSILASLIWMMDCGEVVCEMECPGLDSTFRLVE